VKNQKLELNWIGKDKRPKLEPRILIEDPDKSYGDKRTENMLILGDNLLALKALEQDYAGSVKCIYIDPPYNTGSAFTHYEDGLEHSIWLSLIEARLQILWNLLDPDYGSLWISIDDDEMPYLRVLMDQLIGREKFIAQNIWQKRYSRENREAIGDVHEYIIVYAKNPQNFKEIRNKVPLTEDQAKVYKNPNNDPKGRWRPIPMTAQEGHATPEQFYEIVTPRGAIHKPPEGRCWGLSKKTFDKLNSEGKIWFGKDGKSQPNIIRYLSEVEGMVPWTWWPHEEVGHTDESKKEIHALFGKIQAFDTPKPERLIQRIIHIATKPGDLVLDSFAGSGTTGAVAQKMGRKWIMVELGDHCHTHILPRMKKVCDGTDQGGISKAVNWRGGGGFKYYYMAPSLLKKDRYDQWVINPEYNAPMLAAAMAKHENFRYSPDEVHYWKQGQSSEKDFIFTTTVHLTPEHLDRIHEEMQPGESLLICCKSHFRGADGRYDNITVKKIPGMLLGKCEFDRNDYSLNIVDMPRNGDDAEFVPSGPVAVEAKKEKKKAKGKDAGQVSIFENEKE